jgi:hypothetical protein
MSFSPQKRFVTDRNTPQKKPDVEVLGWSAVVRPVGLIVNAPK